MRHDMNAALISIVAMCAIILVRYFITSGLFAWATEKRAPRRLTKQKQQIMNEIRWSVLCCIIYAVPAGAAAWAWQAKGLTLIYTDMSSQPYWWLAASVIFYLLLHDSWFYWSHRLMHHPKLFRAMHAVHHASKPPTAWAAMSFHWSEALTGAFVIPLLVFVIPIHVAALGLVLTIMTVMGVTNHMGWEIFPQWLVHGRAGKWLITATHHEKHHQSYRGNYGLYFRIWDKICSTDIGLGRFDDDSRKRAFNSD